MLPLFETIQIRNCIMQNLDSHLERVWNSANELWNSTNIKNFEECINSLEINVLKFLETKKTYKLRIDYDSLKTEYTIEEYRKKEIRKISFVEAPEIKYPFKYTERKSLENILISTYPIENERNTSEIIIIQNRQVTDTTYSNLIFEKNSVFFTPKTFLLPGTKRAKYLKEGLCSEIPISTDNIYEFESIHLINAMLDLGDLQYFLH